MSLYNLLDGVNPLKDILLKILDIDQPNGKWKSGRFRGIYLNEDGTEIILYTRNGGGNREHWGFSHADEKEGEECSCAGCVITYHLPKHPNYLRDYDDDFDSTYAYIVFSVPEEFQEFTKSLATGKKPEIISEKFQKTIAEMKKMKKEEINKDERFKPIVEILKKIVDPKNKEKEFKI